MSGLAGPVQTAAAATLTFVPTADAYVSGAASTSNFGTATVLQVGASPSLHTYLTFDVEGVSGSVSSATLRLYATTAGSGSSVHGTSTAWTETGITYGNAPTYGATIATVSNFAAGTWISYNVSSLVAGNGLVGFAYTSASASPISFASREDAAHAPQLLVTSAGVATVPGPPTNASATAGNGQASVSWSAPASDGGSTISAYTATASPGGQTCSTTGALGCTVTGLTNGTSYTFTVIATNAVGPGSPSAPTNAVTPTAAPTVPGPPTNASATAGNGQASVSWSAPASDGGSTISAYTATASPGGQTCSTTGALGCTVTGLTNGTTYTFTVIATNAVGPGSPSAPSNAVTPTTPGPTVFADDFELGNLSRWTSATGLSIQSQIKYAGSWAARATSTGTPRFAYKQLAATYGELYYRQRFYVVSQGSSTLTLGTFQTSAGNAILDFSRASTGKICLHNYVTAVAPCSATKASTGAWHTLQVRMRIGAPGSTDVWLDGIHLTSISLSQSLGSTAIGRVQLGDGASGRTYDAAFDDVTVGTAFITP
jgi:hypothetical protein